MLQLGNGSDLNSGLEAIVGQYKNRVHVIMEGEIDRVRRKIQQQQPPPPQGHSTSASILQPNDMIASGDEIQSTVIKRKKRVCLEQSNTSNSPVPREGTNTEALGTGEDQRKQESRPTSAKKAYSRPPTPGFGAHRTHPQKQEPASESHLVAEGIKSQIAADAASTMRHLLALFMEPAVGSDDGRESQASSAAATAHGRVMIPCVHNESLRSASAQLERAQGEMIGSGGGGAPHQRQQFTASKFDIMLETLTKRTADRFGIGQIESKKLPSETARQLGSLASKGFSIHCLRPLSAARSFPVAIIFDPVVDQPDFDSVSGPENMSRYKCRIKCMLVGLLHRDVPDDSILGHPELRRSAAETATTLNSVSVFEQQARQNRRKKMKATATKTTAAADQPQDELEDATKKLLESCRLPSPLKNLLAEKARHDKQSLRLHKDLPSVKSDTIVSYDQCKVEPQLLIVYEEDDFVHGRPKELATALISRNSSWWENSYSAIEYTMRWSVPIAEVGNASLKDEWVRRRIAFPLAAQHTTVPLKALLSACRRGAVSIDLVGDGERSQFEYRHSFRFEKLKLTASSW